MTRSTNNHLYSGMNYLVFRNPKTGRKTTVARNLDHLYAGHPGEIFGPPPFPPAHLTRISPVYCPDETDTISTAADDSAVSTSSWLFSSIFEQYLITANPHYERRNEVLVILIKIQLLNLFNRFCTKTTKGHGIIWRSICTTRTNDEKKLRQINLLSEDQKVPGHMPPSRGLMTVNFLDVRT